MLGEAARTAADAARYSERYRAAIAAIGARVDGRDLHRAPGISVKLSALHPRYEEAQRERVLRELPPILLAWRSRRSAPASASPSMPRKPIASISRSISSRRSRRRRSSPAGTGSALRVQAYQKRALPLIDWLAALARRTSSPPDAAPRQRRLLGQRDQAQRRSAASPTSRSTRASSRPMCPISPAPSASGRRATRSFRNSRRTTRTRSPRCCDARRAQSAISNSSACTAWARRSTTRSSAWPAQFPCRVYAPVGGHEDLLAYLVRRLLGERRQHLVRQSPGRRARAGRGARSPIRSRASTRSRPKPHPRITLPRDLYGPSARNSRGIDLSDPPTSRRARRTRSRSRRRSRRWRADHRRRGRGGRRRARVAIPADRRASSAASARRARRRSSVRWRRRRKPRPAGTIRRPSERARLLDRAADLLQERMAALIALIVREGGRTIPDAVSEVREAIDHCRYDAARAARRIRRAGRACRARPASATCSSCTAAASSPASRRGIFRSRSSSARSPARSPPAMR